MKRILYGLLCLALFAGCSKDKDKDIGEPDDPVTPTVVTLELSAADLIFEAEGGQKTFTITCNTEWTITNESDWCTTDVTSGEGDKTVTVNTQTYSALEDRNMNLTVKAGDKTLVLGVTQKGKDAIILSKDKFEVANEGGTMSVHVRSNVNYEVTIPETFRSWIQPAPEARSVISDTTYHFAISGNKNDDSRTGYIIFSAASLQDTVRVYQIQDNRLVLTQRKYLLLAKATTITVELKTNVDYEVSVLGDAASWIRQVGTQVDRVDQLQFHIEENTGGILRRAKIAIRDKNSILSDTIYIRQSDSNDPDKQDITEDFDPGFAKVLQEEGYIPDATYITIADVKGINHLMLDCKALTSLAGIEYFESLTSLFCRANQLSSLNLSTCPALYMLVCDTNRLTSLNVSGCTALTSLECSQNQLTSLDVSSCTALTELHCSDNQLTSLDVSGYPALTRLFCSNNRLTSLDVSGCPVLTTLFCRNNPHTSLNASGCPALTLLACEGSQLISLDVSGCTALPELWCEDNQLISLNVSGCTALEDLRCYDNRLTSLDVSSCTALTLLECSQNQLTSLDVSSCTALIDLHCSDNQLTSLDVSNYTALTRLTCYRNQLTSLDVSGCSALTELQCFYNQLTSLNVSGCTALTYFDCEQNQLTSLDLSGYTALLRLYCYSNQLSSLDLSGCTALTQLYCHNNQLTSLDVSSCTALIDLRCPDNQLTSLNVSSCPALTGLWCRNNQLTSLDVNKNTELTELRCSNNRLTSLDVNRNTALTFLSCDNNPGDGESLFPVTAWFDNNTIPENMSIMYKRWRYEDKTISIDFRKAE